MMQGDSGSRPADGGAPPAVSGGGDEDVKNIPYKECIKRAEGAIARIAACDDIDEHVQLVREAERYIREAQARIERAEGDIQRILGCGVTSVPSRAP
jgi:hypothetical protein